MRTRTGMTGRTGTFLLVAAVAATVALTSGCMGDVDPEGVPGTYRSKSTGGEIVLNVDGTFTAKDIPRSDVEGHGPSDPADFSGTWDLMSDRAYLQVDAGDLDADLDIQLYTDPDKVYLQPDPDGPVTLTLTKTAAS